MSNGTMKAVVCSAYGGPEVLQLTRLPKPVPQANEVCIRIHATTVTVADFRIRSFTVPLSFWLPARIILGLTKPKHPILGVEVAGEIVALGRDVRNFNIGDSVYGATLLSGGGYAEYICLPSSGALALKPAQLTYPEAAAIPIGACTALHFLRKAKIKKGQSILIYGASGSVGSFAVQMAKYFGASVTAVCSAKNAEWVTRLGADVVIDYQRSDFEDQLGRYDIVLVAIDKISFRLCNRVLNSEGIYINITQPFRSLHMLWVSNTTKKKIYAGEKPVDTASDLTFLNKMVEEKVLTPIIDRVFPLDQIQEAHRYVEQGHKKGNVAVTVIDQ